MTKKEKFELIAQVMRGTADIEGETADMLAEFCDNEIVLLGKRAAASAASAKKRRAANDTLKDVVAQLLTADYQSVDAVTALVNDPEITHAKVQNRLSKLVREGVAVKESLPDAEGSTRKIMKYKLA